MPKTYDACLNLNGLTLAPSQVWGGIRIVPLLRAEPRADLKLHRRSVDEDVVGVALEGKAVTAPDVAYFSYVPHAFVLEVQGKSAVVSHGTQLARRRDGQRLGRGRVRLLHRMAKSEGAGTLRFLPLHLAMEGLLALHFGGPDIMWPEYSREAISRGLSPRYEVAYPGAMITGLEDALRTFEIHPTQCGLLLFVADAFASAFVVPQPSEYRGLHRTVLQDMFSELLVRYSEYAHNVQASRVALDGSAVRSFADLERALDRAEQGIREYEHLLADGLFGRAVRFEEVYHVGPFCLERFRSDMALGEENYIGERIVDAAGQLQYTKVMRLSDAQGRRAFLLMKLHEHAWNLSDTAAALQIDVTSLLQRLESAGFGYLVRQHLRAFAWRQRS